MERKRRYLLAFLSLALCVMVGCETMGSFSTSSLVPGSSSLPEQWEGDSE